MTAAAERGRARPGRTPGRALVAEVKGNSLDDGPGIRSVVFFKGCPLACVWCHNPETKRTRQELSFDPERCRGALDCIEACELGALVRSLPGFVDRERCDLCMRCVEVCPSGALEAVGRPFDADDIVASLSRYERFYRVSGGGVTLSGGEPTVYMADAGVLAARLRGLGIHVLLETSGHFALERYTELLEPHLDQVYFDLKLLDDSEHRQHCGISNRVILKNFRELHRRALDGGVAVLPRVPLVPGITATEHNLAAIAGFLRRNHATRVSLLPYNPLWGEKSRKLGDAPSLEITSWMSAEELDVCRSHFEGFELVG